MIIAPSTLYILHDYQLLIDHLARCILLGPNSYLHFLLWFTHTSVKCCNVYNDVEIIVISSAKPTPLILRFPLLTAYAIFLSSSSKSLL